MITGTATTFWFEISYSTAKSALLKIGGALASNRSYRKQEQDLTAIIRGCQREDETSQEQLYKKYYGYALSVSMKYCLNREDATEVVNDSFMKVFKHINQFDIERPFKPWLRKIVVNASIDKIRKKPENHLDIEDVPLGLPQLVDSDLKIKETLQLLKFLPEMYRTVFNMYEIDGYSHKEISEELGIGESSSRTYLLRAKNRLRELYNKHFTGKIYQNV
jgi:RNA polymerase sigma factor (sigma-70 family)